MCTYKCWPQCKNYMRTYHRLSWSWMKDQRYIPRIRRPLRSLGLGGTAPGITVGVRHWLWPHLWELSKLRPARGTPPKTCVSGDLKPCKTASISAFQAVAWLPWPRYAAPARAATIGPANCFYIRLLKLLRGTFWPRLKSLKTLQKPSKTFKALKTLRRTFLQNSFHDLSKLLRRLAPEQWT